MEIANQIAATHMSRNSYMVYAQPHLHAYVTELGKRRRGRSLFYCILVSEEQLGLAISNYLLEAPRRGRDVVGRPSDPLLLCVSIMHSGRTVRPYVCK